MFDAGRQTFLFEAFGGETFWGGTFKLHQTIAGSSFGGVGAGVSPKTALAVGLKVDVDALPQGVIDQLKNGTLNLDDPANTLALIQLNAVRGITGFFKADGSMKSLGIQCAFCHSTVDDSLAPGIGHRLDGWGPGKFDAQLFLDGQAAKPGGARGSSATLIPPAFGLVGVNLHTSTGFFNVRNDPDLVTPKLAALQFYQLAIPAPAPPAGSFDQAAAGRGKVFFSGKARCATCHVPPLFSEPGWNMHTPAEIGLTAPNDDFQANRSPGGRFAALLRIVTKPAPVKSPHVPRSAGKILPRLFS